MVCFSDRPLSAVAALCRTVSGDRYERKSDKVLCGRCPWLSGATRGHLCGFLGGSLQDPHPALL